MSYVISMRRPGDLRQPAVSVDMSGTSHFRSRSRREKVLGLGPSQKYFSLGPGSKTTFWSRSCSEKILVLVLVKKNFGPGPG